MGQVILCQEGSNNVIKDRIYIWAAAMHSTDPQLAGRRLSRYFHPCISTDLRLLNLGKLARVSRDWNRGRASKGVDIDRIVESRDVPRSRQQPEK